MGIYFTVNNAETYDKVKGNRVIHKIQHNLICLVESHSNVERFTWRRVGREKSPPFLNIIAQTLELVPPVIQYVSLNDLPLIKYFPHFHIVFLSNSNV